MPVAWLATVILRYSKRPWATSVVSALRGKIPPREACQTVAEFSLVAFDGGEEVIGFLVFDEESSRFPLGMQGIGGHDLALDVDVFEQAAQFRDFVGFPGDFFLCDGRPLSMHESAEEMDLGPVFPDRAFEHFAIDGHRFKSGNAQQPGTDGGIQGRDVGALQDATEGRLGRRHIALRPGIESGANALQLRLGQSAGPLSHRGIALRLGEDRGHGHGQDGREGMLLAPAVAGIGQAKENLAQAFHLRVAQGDGLHRGFSPFGLRLRLGQPGAHLWLEGIEQEAFGLAVVDIAAAAERLVPKAPYFYLKGNSI